MWNVYINGKFHKGYVDKSQAKKAATRRERQSHYLDNKNEWQYKDKLEVREE